MNKTTWIWRVGLIVPVAYVDIANIFAEAFGYGTPNFHTDLSRTGLGPMAHSIAIPDCEQPFVDMLKAAGGGYLPVPLNSDWAEWGLTDQDIRELFNNLIVDIALISDEPDVNIHRNKMLYRNNLKVISTE